MKKKVADLVAEFLIANEISTVFSVVGGGAMHLNDAFGHNTKLNVLYNHHEQASAIAAEAYSRLNNKIAAVCVTTGPGGTNALTGVVGGWLDSIPMLIISGQVRYDTTVDYMKQNNPAGLRPRAIGDQEFEIVESVKPMTKYAVMIKDPKEILYELKKALYIAKKGRPGPVWIDIPVDIQGMYVEENALNTIFEENIITIPQINDEDVKEVISLIKHSKRPVIYAGSGIRLSGAYNIFKELLPKLGIPVVTYFNTVDLLENTNPLYVGRGGNMGDRAGNFAVQNSDLVLSFGSRLSIRQVGYNYKTWARYARVVMIDIDLAEMHKPTIHVDLRIHGDIKEFLIKMDKLINKEVFPIFDNTEWNQKCLFWREKYPVVNILQNQQKEKVNVYAFIRKLSLLLPPNSIIVGSNGACCVVGHQAIVIKEGTRFILNSAIASMGYGLPASIGLCCANNRNTTICLEGDGSIMMNLQELQTIKTNRLPIKIFLVNNNGYHSIRITQNNLFSENKKIGIGAESGDLGFPNFKKIAKAFGIKYFSIKQNSEIERKVRKVLEFEGPILCEVFTDTNQVWEPKNSARKLADGTFVSSPLEDLAPFLSREELKKNMFIPLVEER